MRSRVLPFLMLVLLEATLVPTAARGAQVASPTNPVPNTSAPAAPQKVEITGVTVEGRGTKAEFALGNTILTTLANGNVDVLENKKSATNPVGLFLNSLFMKGIDAERVPNAPDTLKFQLQYTGLNKDAWSQLFGRKMGSFKDGGKIHIAVGLGDESLVTSDYSQEFYLEFLPDTKAHVILGVSIFVVAATVILGKWSSMLRDSGGTYSLGRTQMAVWFATIVFAFLFIYAVTGTPPPITQGALILMGIGAGTALGAAAIDENKKTASSADLVKLSAERLSLEQKISDLEQKEPPNGDA